MATAPPTISDLLDQVSALLGRRDLLLQQEQDWAAGTATGGPNSDGNYPIDDSTGFQRLIPSPAKIAALAVPNASFLTDRCWPEQFDALAGSGTGHDDAPALQAMFDHAAATGVAAALSPGKIYYPRSKITVDPALITFISNGSDISFAQKAFGDPTAEPNLVGDPNFATGAGWTASTNTTAAPTYGSTGLTFNDPPAATQLFLELGQQVTAPAGSTLRVTMKIGEIAPVTVGANTFRSLLVGFRKDTGTANGSISGGGVSGAAFTISSNDPTYAPGETVTWDVVISTANPYLRIQSNAGLKITSIRVAIVPDNTCFLFQSSNVATRGSAKRGWYGLSIIGRPDQAAFVDAIVFNTANGSYSSRAVFFGLNIGPSCGRGLVMQNNTYLLAFIAPQVTASVACIDTLVGASNSGENIGIVLGNMGGGSVAGSIGIRNMGGFSFHLTDHSIDFVDQWYVGTGGCMMDQGWLEKNAPVAGALPYIDLRGGWFCIRKTRVQVDGSTVPTIPYPFMVAQDAILEIEADTPYNLHGTAGALCGGAGRFSFRGVGGAAKEVDVITKRDVNHNILGQGGQFEDATIVIPAWIAAQAGQQQTSKYTIGFAATSNFTADVAQGERALVNSSVSPTSALAQASIANSDAVAGTKIANYQNSGGFTGTTVVGSNVITAVSPAPTSSTAANKFVSGTGIPIGAKVIAYSNSGLTLTLDRACTAAATGVAVSTSNIILLSQPWNGVSGTGVSISALLAGTAAASMLVSADFARSGTQSLKFTKAGVGAAPWLAYIAIPVKAGRAVGMEFYFKVPPIAGSTSTTQVFFTTSFAQILGADRNGAPVLGGLQQFISDLPQTGINLATGQDWTLVQSSTNNANVNTAHDGYAPEWASHLLLTINLASVPNGFAIYLDDLQANLM